MKKIIFKNIFLLYLTQDFDSWNIHNTKIDVVVIDCALTEGNVEDIDQNKAGWKVEDMHCTFAEDGHLKLQSEQFSWQLI